MAKEDNFDIKEYSLQNLTVTIANCANASPHIIEAKNQVTYIHRYLNYLNSKTIFIEKNYIDRDFFEDFVNHYVRCFHTYSSRCTRLHFFNTDFSNITFESILQGSQNSLKITEIEEAYLGFVVIKPLPKNVIGRVCLKTYPSQASEGMIRYFPVTRTYNANLFGIPLKVPNSLAFQEQDSEIAACATSALWSVFQGTGIQYQHPILSPGEITKAATKNEAIDSKRLPGKGLDFQQMAKAIRYIGLEPFPLEIEDESHLKRTIYAYLKGKIPMVMGFELLHKQTTDSSTKSQEDYKIVGHHAVVVTGYCIDDKASPITKVPSENHQDNVTINLTSTKINKIYVHDDQVGPFARMPFDGITVDLEIANKKKDYFSLYTSWGDNQNYRAKPTALLIPLYHKVRIPFKKIYNVVIYFNQFIKGLRRSNFELLNDELEWDIYLTTINNYKNSILCSTDLESEIRSKVLTKSMPKYIWCATGYCEGNKMLDLIFDATDIEQGKFFVCAVEYDVNFSAVLRKVSKQDNLEQAFKIGEAWRILMWFKERDDI